MDMQIETFSKLPTGPEVQEINVNVRETYYLVKEPAVKDAAEDLFSYLQLRRWSWLPSFESGIASFVAGIQITSGGWKSFCFAWAAISFYRAGLAYKNKPKQAGPSSMQDAKNMLVQGLKGRCEQVSPGRKTGNA